MKANQTNRRRKTQCKQSPSTDSRGKASSTRGRPRRLKVLNLTFTVLFLNDAQMAGSGAVGFCDPETQTIGVVNSQANDALQDTFLHEVLHAICHVMGLRETAVVTPSNTRGKPLDKIRMGRIRSAPFPGWCGF